MEATQPPTYEYKCNKHLQQTFNKKWEETNMKKNYLWRKMTSGLMAAAVTVTAMPGLGLTMVQAEEKKTLKVAMECSYAPYNWTQPDDSNGAVPINDSNEYAYGFQEAPITHMDMML